MHLLLKEQSNSSVANERKIVLTSLLQAEQNKLIHLQLIKAKSDSSRVIVSSRRARRWRARRAAASSRASGLCHLRGHQGFGVVWATTLAGSIFYLFCCFTVILNTLALPPSAPYPANRTVQKKKVHQHKSYTEIFLIYVISLLFMLPKVWVWFGINWDVWTRWNKLIKLFIFECCTVLSSLLDLDLHQSFPIKIMQVCIMKLLIYSMIYILCERCEESWLGNCD
jgi:hypothetical protein